MKPRHTFVALGVVAVASLSFAGVAQAEDWDELAQCESSGDWSTDTGNGYSGGLQFDSSTWSAYGGTEYASSADGATREQQIEIAEKVLDAQGPSAWPSCSSSTGWTSGDTSTERSSTQPSTDTSTYTVSSGDTLGSIADEHAISWRSLYEQNGDVLDSPHEIFPGQSLTVE